MKSRKKHKKYIEKIYRAPGVIEHEFSYKGKYGAKGEKRAVRKKATPEQIKKQNQTNRINYIRRTIQLNWGPGDLWCCLQYPEGYRLLFEDVCRDVDRFITNVRNAYKKLNHVFKWYLRLEVGERGGVHIHIIVNRIWGEQTDILLEKKWRYLLRKRGIKEEDTHGKVDWKTLYDEGGYQGLAAYIAKIPEEGSEEYEQLSLFDKTEQKRLCSVRCSKNLIRPDPEVKEYYHTTMRKIIEYGPKATPGFYIDKNSIECGVNKYTGLSYFHYTEFRIQGRERGQP